ncbi:hypothetical protein KVT40_003492 [Elsinoe batatas]|uniref:Uncharacterized protein n=1 Tax=Elsinoe batatas TaxID=2601811 RepID=A0A8K0PIL3_9PEZI|nr:hypothetical protein KVT40_003492 [Elsinoe batatas]
MICSCGFEFCYFCGEQWMACICDTARAYTTRLVKPLDRATEDRPEESAVAYLEGDCGRPHADLIPQHLEPLYHAQVLRMRQHIADRRPREAISTTESNTRGTVGRGLESGASHAPDGRECEHEYTHLVDDTECDMCTEDSGYGTYQCLICCAILCDICCMTPRSG